MGRNGRGGKGSGKVVMDPTEFGTDAYVFYRLQSAVIDP